jgi:hypothetical protein
VALGQKRTELQEELQPKKDEVASNKEEITGLEGEINNLKISKDSASREDKAE